MNKDYLIKKLDIDCPICNEAHSIEVRNRTTQGLVKNEIVEYEEVYYLCPFCVEEENEFIPAGIMDDNLLRARNSYRTLKGLLTSNDIAKIRELYGVTQSDFSAMLGWGDVTVTRYESKMIQDETYDSIMCMVRDNPMFALESLDKHKERFSVEKYNKIRKDITDKVEEFGNLYLKKQEISSLYVPYQDESDYNGYKVLDMKKLANVMGYFAHFTNNLYKVKLMKLLWYTDSLHFKRHGKSMTGLVYRHMPYGALPIAFDEIIYSPTVKIIEEIICEDISYKIEPNKDVNISEFSLEELSVLQVVASKFKNIRAREIVDYMHKEKAYSETEAFQIIPYSFAKDLKDLR